MEAFDVEKDITGRIMAIEEKVNVGKKYALLVPLGKDRHTPCKFQFYDINNKKLKAIFEINKETKQHEFTAPENAVFAVAHI